MRKLFFVISLTLAFNFPAGLNSINMNSENYKIFADVISVGGERSTSTTYWVFDTLGEAGGVSPTTSTSANYLIYAGFQALDLIYISASLSASSISLGTLSATAAASGSQTLTVSTNASSGYTATILEDGNLRSGSNDINDVSDGTVTAGAEEYGLRTSGNAGQMNNSDTAITAVAQTIASTSTAATSEQTTLTYKAAISSATAYGTYSQTVTITTTANY